MTGLVEQRLGLEVCWRIADLRPGHGVGSHQTVEVVRGGADAGVMQQVDHDAAAGFGVDAQRTVHITRCGPGHVFDGYAETVLTCEIAQCSKDVDRLVERVAKTRPTEIGDCEDMTGPDLAGPAHEGNRRPRIEAGSHPHHFGVEHPCVALVQTRPNVVCLPGAVDRMLPRQTQSDSGAAVETAGDVDESFGRHVEERSGGQVHVSRIRIPNGRRHGARLTT